MTLTMQIKKFNQRVQNMNQAGSRELILGAQEARDLQAEIYNLLAQISSLQQKLSQTEEKTSYTSLVADGGSFSGSK